MDSPKLHPHWLETSVTLILIISLTFFPSNSETATTKDIKGLKQKRLVLGSRPPRCVNKCLSCRPCTAALVVSSPHRRNGSHKTAAQKLDDGYYLLSWKCKCGNKFFQP